MCHHSLTAYGRVALSAADVVVPVRQGPLAPLTEQLAAQATPLAVRHRIVRVSTDGLAEAVRAAPLAVSTMGRGYDADPAGFLAPAAAGRHAALLAKGTPTG